MSFLSKTLVKAAFTFCILSFSTLMWGQLDVVITQVPANTPLTDTLYISGNFNDWNAKKENHRLQKQANGRYRIRLENPPEVLEYKITRGTWESVEGNENGQVVDNRVWKQPKDKPYKTLEIQVESWEDLKSVAINQAPFISFVLDEIPENTPHDASIFVVGNFNGWRPGDEDFKFKKQEDGTYRIRFQTQLDSFQYKFTRGTWESAEGRPNGRALPNRLYTEEQFSQGSGAIHATIESWEDLDARPINSYTFILLLAGIQGLLLILAINGLQNNNKSANQILSALILIMSIALIGRVSVYDRAIFQWQPKLILLSSIVFLTYGPLFYFYIQQLLTSDSAKATQRKWLHAIPFCLHLLAYLPLIFMDKDTFITRIIDEDFNLLFSIVAGIALVINWIYWLWGYRLVTGYAKSTEKEHSFEQNLNYLNTIIIIQGICLSLWATTALFLGLDYFLDTDLRWATDKMTDTVWIVFSGIAYCLGYFAMSQPAIFRLPDKTVEEQVEEETRYKDSPIAQADLLAHKKKLKELMDEKEPYKHAKLTLAELAALMETNSHTLSRVINEGYKKNFYDFINSYRVDEFKRRVAMEQFQHHTLLAIALDVGFNSKSSFNRSFKKLAKMTPRQYLKLVQEKQKAEAEES